ncbi:hypothetical protein IU486_13865 [Streptomyces gardneri]|uniref:hypothetical protein n=1 Tax=Nocardia TaxID=1817 RepID=UPI00135AC78D|nr:MULTISPECIES: hypothetical protein [Nocardia]MBF6165858.1 hypothetical protein [Streptomyces gardneri]MBF6203181.1 hypothetical protein [Streptomyces gardneri]UAK30027.1 hypothetical protein K8O92_18890 [Nocardia asteroides]
MSTAISDTTPSTDATGAELDRRVIDLDPARDDLGYESVQRLLRGAARARALTPAYRSAVDRRPPGARPGGGMVDYDRAPRISAPRRGCGDHPMRRVEQAQIGFAVLAVAALLTALVVVGFIALAHVRAGDWSEGQGASVPAAVEGSGMPGGGNPR